MTQPDRSKLAIDGGAPVRSTPFAPWPHYAEDEIAAVQRVLASGKVNYWTGQECRGFEQDYATLLGRPHAIALANGTLALELALRAFGIGAGDEVIVTCRSFIASAGAAVVCGATPVLADVDADSQNISAATVEPMISPRTRAIIAVHLAGWPCDMDALQALAKRHGLYLIEDCAQAHGAQWRGRPVGSFGDASAFSFCQDKIITTGGEGGLLVLSDTAAWERAWSYKDHGKSHAAMFQRQHAPGYRWVHETFGSNWRLTEMQAIIGRRQLKKLDGWVARRRAHGQRLTSALAALPGLRVANPPAPVKHAYYKFYAFLDPHDLLPG